MISKHSPTLNQLVASRGARSQAGVLDKILQLFGAFLLVGVITFLVDCQGQSIHIGCHVEDFLQTRHAQGDGLDDTPVKLYLGARGRGLVSEMITPAHRIAVF